MSFDPQAFLDSSITESNDTKIVPVPVGDYTAIVDKIVPRTWTSKDGTQSGVALDILWIIEDQDVKTFLGRDTVTCKQGLMLDLTPTGQLDMSKGRNVGLGRLREAVNLNKPNEAFSFAMLPGQMAKVSVTHRQNPQDPEEVFAEVRKVHPIN